MIKRNIAASAKKWQNGTSPQKWILWKISCHCTWISTHAAAYFWGLSVVEKYKSRLSVTCAAYFTEWKVRTKPKNATTYASQIITSWRSCRNAWTSFTFLYCIHMHTRTCEHIFCACAYTRAGGNNDLLYSSQRVRVRCIITNN